jgi:hypothetical protein
MGSAVEAASASTTGRLASTAGRPKPEETVLNRVATIVIAALVAVAGAGGAVAGEHAFAGIASEYEEIRQALIQDSTEGVQERALAIQFTASRLSRSFSADAAGVAEKDAAAARALLPEITERAGRLAAAEGLAAVRSELAELTKPLVRYLPLVQGPRPIVVYCPMVKKSWLQPDEAIGNPYDPSMLRCGEVVGR